MAAIVIFVLSFFGVWLGALLYWIRLSNQIDARLRAEGGPPLRFKYVNVSLGDPRILKIERTKRGIMTIFFWLYIAGVLWLIGHANDGDPGSALIALFVAAIPATLVFDLGLRIVRDRMIDRGERPPARWRLLRADAVHLWSDADDLTLRVMILTAAATASFGALLAIPFV